MPTFREAGLQVPARGSWYGLFVPARTPPEVIAKIERAIAALATDPAAQEAMRNIGAEPVFGGSREFAAGIVEDSAFLDALVQQYPVK